MNNSFNYSLNCPYEQHFKLCLDLLECSKQDLAATISEGILAPTAESIEIDDNINGYKCQIITKYFRNEVVLVDLDEVELGPLEGREFEILFEAALFCFDRGDVRTRFIHFSIFH